jgi:hypothetical protein
MLTQILIRPNADLGWFNKTDANAFAAQLYPDQMILHSLAPEIDQAYRWLSGFSK